MKMALVSLISILFLVGCGGPEEGGKASPDITEEFSVNFPSLRTHGNLLSYTIQGDSNRNFGTISFHTANTCTNSSRLNSGDRSDLVGGMVVNLSGSNTTHNIYYSVTDPAGAILIACELLVNYVHDSISPAAPNYTPASLSAQAGFRTKDIPFIPQIGSSYIPVDADGIRFYGNPTKTIYMGEILRTDLLTGTINLTANSGNLLYVSFVDLAGNESALFNTGVGIINDSTAPSIPVATQALNRFVTTPTVVLQANASLDSLAIRITHRETLQVQNFTRTALAAGVTLSNTLNATNTFDIVALDDVGNESLPLTYIVVNDSIAPSAPTLHADTSLLVSLPVKGPSNTFKFLLNESGSISVYSNPGLTTLVATGTASTWETGITITFPLADGTNTLYVVGSDPAGNNSSPMALTFTADSTVPANLSLIPASLALNNSFQQSLVAPIRASANSDIAQVVISGGVSTQTYTMAAIVTGVNYPLNPNALNTLNIKSIDLAGNESAGLSLAVTNDTIAPVASITFPASNGKPINSSGVIRGTCEANSVTVNVGSVYTVPCVAGLWSLGLDGSRAHGVALSIQVTETDAALNQGSASRTSVIDNIAPTISIDPITLPAISNNPNHLLMGNCEAGSSMVITGDTSGAIPCLGGFFVIPLNILSEGTRNFTLTQTDEALNAGSLNFSLNFDFTAPPAITLATSVTNLHNTAISANSLNIVGNSVEDVPIKIYRDASLTDLVGTYTRANLISGITVSLSSDRENPFYIVGEDAAGNKSTPAFVTVFQRLALSKLYDTTQNNIYLSSDVGMNVTYRYKVTVTNNSTDTNINRRILLESMTVSSPTSQIVVNPSSTCLTGPVQGFGTCEIWVDITYTSITTNNFNLTLTYPNGTTKTLNIQHKSAGVTTNASAVLPATLPTNMFSDDLFETRNGESFVTTPYFTDLNFGLYDQTALAVRRRTQATSSDKLYTVCANNTDRLCAYAKATPSMEETLFTEPVLGTSFSETGAIPSSMIWFVGTVGTKDVVVVSKYKNSTFIDQEAALIVYDKPTKTYARYWLKEGATDFLSVQRPKYGSSLSGNFLYFMAYYTGNQALYKINVTTGILSRLDTAKSGSGYFVNKDKVIYSKSTLEVVSRSMVDDSEIVISDVNLSQDLHICANNWFTSGKVMNVEDRNDFATTGHHAVYLLCDAANNKKKAVYANGSSHTVVRDITGTTDGLFIQNLNTIDQFKALYTLRRTGTNTLYHHYVDVDANVSSSIQESHPDADYKAIPVYIEGKIYKQNQNILNEYDLNFSVIRPLNDFGHRNWYLFKSANTPYVLQYAAKSVTYYDLEFSQWLNYANLTTAIPGTVNFEGFFRGHLYLRDGTSTSARFLRVPLYSK